MQIEVYMDKVIINGWIVMRPDNISRSEWLSWWEAAKCLDNPGIIAFIKE